MMKSSPPFYQGTIPEVLSVPFFIRGRGNPRSDLSTCSSLCYKEKSVFSHLSITVADVLNFSNLVTPAGRAYLVVSHSYITGVAISEIF